MRWFLPLSLALLLAACAPAATNNAAFELQLLHFADVDGGRDIVGNAPRFSALLNNFRSQKPDNTLVLSSGDNWIPGPEYNVAEDDALASVVGGTAGAGRAHVAWLNALGVQASAFGNHEFDSGTGAVAALVGPGSEEGDTWTGAAFPYLSTNLDFSTDEALAPLISTDGAPNTDSSGKIAAYTTIAVGGETIGVVGATTPSLGSISSIGDITMQPENPEDLDALAALIQADVDALTAQGINKIILLAHMQQIEIEQALAPKLTGVDIIVAGGSNTILADENDRLRADDVAEGTYPLQFAGADGSPVLIVNTDGDYNYLGRLVVGFDASGVLVPASLDNTVSGAYATDEQGLTDQGLSAANAVPEVQAISDALGAALTARAGNVVGYTSVYLNGARRSVRTEETNLGNLAADAQLVYAQSVDPTTSISIKNGGGIRGAIGACIVPPGSTGEAVCDIPQGIPGVSEPGSVSQLDLEIAFRFNNGLTLVTVTGEQLKAIMEQAVSAVENVGGPFPQIAGMTLTFDPNQAVGSRVVGLAANDASGSSVTVVENGAVFPDAATATFRVVTLGFLAEGGDDYPFPTDAAANVVNLVTEGVRTGTFTFADDGTEQDVLAEYFAANHPDAEAAFAVADTPASEDTRIINLAQ
jgi:2',3'-cyclic-nucleotide 2'-phosphodiesterase (5'-nucleotidase family)